MAAEFSFSESNGAEVVSDGISNVNFGSVDAPNLNTTTYPITYNTSSFSKYIRAKFAGTFATISAMKFWKSAGVYVVGETLKAGANVAFATPSQTATGDSDIPTDVGSALAIQAADGSATIVVPGYTKYFRMQTGTTLSSPSGSVNQKTLIFQYDEI